VGKSDEQRLAKMIRKNMAKVEAAKPKARQKYDPTLPPQVEEDLELRTFFSDMKKREF
jgi:hypothetical protein